MSFQRRVGAANRGALPYWLLSRRTATTRVLLPLQQAESLWIAVMADRALVVAGQAGPDSLHIEEVSDKSSARVLYALDGIVRSGRLLPLDAAALEIVDAEPHLERDGLFVTLGERAKERTDRIGIVAATPRLYAALSGVPAPPPSSEADQYGGWLLP